MKLVIKLLIILNFCSCTYFNFTEINDAKESVKAQCPDVVEASLVRYCESGVQYFAFEGLTSLEVSGNEEKISNYIESIRKKATVKCNSFYGDDDRTLIACDKGVELAEQKAREMFLQASNISYGEVETSEFAINENGNNRKNLMMSESDFAQKPSAVSI